MNAAADSLSLRWLLNMAGFPTRASEPLICKACAESAKKRWRHELCAAGYAEPR